MVFDDVRMQMTAKHWGVRFNRKQPPKQVDFIQCFVLELPDRPGSPVFCCEVGLYKLNPVDQQLESAWFQPLNLKCNFMVSKFAFKCNLYHYSERLIAGEYIKYNNNSGYIDEEHLRSTPQVGLALPGVRSVTWIYWLSSVEPCFDAQQ